MYTRVVTLWLNVSPLLNLVRLQTCTDRDIHNRTLNTVGEFPVKLCMYRYANTKDLQKEEPNLTCNLSSPWIYTCNTLDVPCHMGNGMNRKLQLGLTSPHNWGHILTILLLFSGHELNKPLKRCDYSKSMFLLHVDKGSHPCTPDTTDCSRQYLQQDYLSRLKIQSLVFTNFSWSANTKTRNLQLV